MGTGLGLGADINYPTLTNCREWARLPFTVALELGSGVFAELLGGRVQLIQQLLRIQSRSVTGGWDHGFAFVLIHETGGFEQSGFVFGWDGQKSVFVGVDELAGLNAPAEYFHFAIPADRAPVGMANTQAGSQSFESGIGHLIQIADASIGNGPYAPQGTMGVAVNFTPCGAHEVGNFNSSEFIDWH